MPVSSEPALKSYQAIACAFVYTLRTGKDPAVRTFVPNMINHRMRAGILVKHFYVMDAKFFLLYKNKQRRYGNTLFINSTYFKIHLQS